MFCDEKAFLKNEENVPLPPYSTEMGFTYISSNDFKQKNKGFLSNHGLLNNCYSVS